jgi:SAM-dependent methyltransferase
VAPDGQITAIDASNEAVAASRARVARENLEGHVDVRAGDAAKLPFPDSSFDFVVAAQVYCYVPDVARAVGEAARVLRKGGRLVVLDTDWDTCVYHAADPVLNRRILAARFGSQFAHAHLPRDMHALIRGVGLSLADAQAIPIIETRHDPDSFGAGMIPAVRHAALNAGIAREDVAGWVRDLESRTADGAWFFSVTRFVFTATK